MGRVDGKHTSQGAAETPRARSLAGQLGFCGVVLRVPQTDLGSDLDNGVSARVIGCKRHARGNWQRGTGKSRPLNGLAVGTVHRISGCGTKHTPGASRRMRFRMRVPPPRDSIQEESQPVSGALGLAVTGGSQRRLKTLPFHPCKNDSGRSGTRRCRARPGWAQRRMPAAKGGRA